MGCLGARRVAVDGAGNVYIGDELNRAIEEVPHAFVNTAPITEGPGAGNDALPVVLPVTQNLSGPLAPASNQPWLTITGVTNGVVSFSFTGNTGLFSRTANISLLGQTIPVTKAIGFGATCLREGPSAGSDSVALAASPAARPTGTA